MTTKICPNCYQVNCVGGSPSNLNYCMWCGNDLREEEIIDTEDTTQEEVSDMMTTAKKIQTIKAKQLINAFDKEKILASEHLLLMWWLALKHIEKVESRFNTENKNKILY